MADIEFLSTRQAAQRLGISLGTVQNMVESGALEAWKTTGGHRRIPTTSVDTLLAQRKSMTGGAEAASHLDILITEDDPGQQMLYRTTIEHWRLPLQLRILGNGFDGLLQIGQRPPDILIANLTMAGMDGFEMIRHLRANPDLGTMDIIVVTPPDQKEMSQKELPPDVTVFTKPIPFHELKGFTLGRLATRRRSPA